MTVRMRPSRIALTGGLLSKIRQTIIAISYCPGQTDKRTRLAWSHHFCQMRFLGVPPFPAEIGDASEGVVVLLGRPSHIVPLPGSLAYVVPVEAAPQGAFDAAAEVGESVAEQAGFAVLHRFGKGPSGCRDDRRAAKLRFDVDAAEGFEVDGGCQQAGEAARKTPRSAPCSGGWCSK